MRIWLRRRFERQARLMGAMMERIGIEPELAASRGRLYDAANRRCLWCAAHEECGKWIEQHQNAERGPDFCPNARFFEATSRS
ncbi:DUF6455 family protein [Bosea sp. (in: a-proteobacteria)]|uniref:DUF6455 family protein n=1 Tax=Bosea vestrisii TaxID=151416 RepID=A0ABW0HDY6_9HYPH|nr:DUF6455 family protein [Bosea sp. (in: a-proteobacteria)]MBA4222487.1 hypothetical protein [Methylobacterium sp.]MBR3194347.1 hypothetical protein [Bosea sp. (in: a-proteobacteria)]